MAVLSVDLATRRWSDLGIVKFMDRALPYLSPRSPGRRAPVLDGSWRQ
jgi:hypothetical protein